MKKKAAILTLNGYENYGNRLQNYAVQEVLSQLGFECDTILIDRKNLKSEGFVNRFKKISSFSEFSSKLYKKINNKLNQNVIKKRRYILMKFSERYISETNYKISKDYIPNHLCTKYEFFIVGSDQVWNPNNLHGTTFYFLTFVKDKEKRIAYAPSFGIPELPDEYKERYKKWLSVIPYLSVREESGAKIVKELTGRDVPVLIDPTLMLTKEKWLSIAKEDPYKPDRPYLLTYFLGEVPKETRKRVKETARENNLEIVRLADIRDKKRYIAGPSEFIDYINSASLVCTDSFHGSVFSILMETPFIVFDRVGTTMYSRIETLLKKFNLHSRQANHIKEDEIFNIDFLHIPPILEEERKKALNFLKKALKIDENN